MPSIAAWKCNYIDVIESASLITLHCTGSSRLGSARLSLYVQCKCPSKAVGCKSHRYRYFLNRSFKYRVKYVCVENNDGLWNI